MSSRTAVELDWHTAEELLAAIEHQSFLDLSRDQFFAVLADGLTTQCGAEGISVSIIWPDRTERFGSFGTSLNHSRQSPSEPQLSPGKTSSKTLNTDDGELLVTVRHCMDADTILDFQSLFPACSATVAQRLRELIETLAVITGYFCIRKSIRALQVEEARRVSIEKMVRDLADCESTPDWPHELCGVIQTTLGIDRVSLVRMKSDRAALLGSSAAAQISARTRPVQLLEQLVEALPREMEQLEIVQGHPTPDPIELDEIQQQYLEESDVRLFKAISLKSAEISDGSSRTYLVLEHFTADWPNPAQQATLEDALPHLEHAARRLVAVRESTWKGRFEAWAGDGGRRWAMIGGISLLAIFVLCLFPVKLKIHVPGTLKPVRRQGIFSPTDAVVDRLLVKHGEYVTAGQTLVILRDTELENEERRITGEIDTLMARLESLKAARIRHRTPEPRTSRDGDLSAQESDLRAQLKGFTAQLELLRDQTARLTITSPISGQINRWDLKQAFGDRPLVHGQFLFEVLDVSGDWEIELEIPDDDIGYVLTAQESRPCVVTYLFRTNPQTRYQSVIEEISSVSQLSEDNSPIVKARAPAMEINKDQYRVGTSVLAKIQCGYHSAGFVLFREVIEFLQRLLWF